MSNPKLPEACIHNWLNDGTTPKAGFRRERELQHSASFDHFRIIQKSRLVAHGGRASSLAPMLNLFLLDELKFAFEVRQGSEVCSHVERHHTHDDDDSDHQESILTAREW